MTSSDVSDFMAGANPDRYRVMVPLDGSQRAEKALAYLPVLSPVGTLEAYLVSVIDDLEYFGPDRVERERHLFEVYLKDQVASLGSGLASAQSLILSGNPASVLIEEAQRLNIDLIIMSSHGRSGIERWRLGSVADKVVRGAHCNTLILGSQAPDAPARITRVLVPLDGSELAEQALPVAKRFVANLGAELHLVQIVSTIAMVSTAPFGMGNTSPELYDAVIKGAESYMARAGEATGATRSVALVGLPADGILTYASENAIDLIIMTSHGRGGLLRTALGSVTDRLVGGPAPVLIVRGR